MAHPFKPLLISAGFLLDFTDVLFLKWIKNTDKVIYLCTMLGDEKLKNRWRELHRKLSDQFADGESLELDAVIYLVGIQELGQLNRKFKKDDKINLMHIAICRLLEPLGYYEFDYFDKEGWPHYKFIEPLPPLKAGEQSLMMKEALVNYFLEKEYIS